MNLDAIQKQVIVAMKSGDRTRLDILRLLVNQIKLISKNDGNRLPSEDDVITAVNRMIKQARETRSYMVDEYGSVTNDDNILKVKSIDAEIDVVSEFLPTQMDREGLHQLIKTILVDAPESKAARGFVMKELNSKYRGEFDSRQANELLGEMI